MSVIPTSTRLDGRCGRTIRPLGARKAECIRQDADFYDGMFHAERIGDQASDNHNKTGQNVLYMDYHVAWADNPNVGVNGDNIYLVNGVTNYLGDEAPADATDTFLLPACTAPCTIQP